MRFEILLRKDAIAGALGVKTCDHAIHASPLKIKILLCKLR